ncbi:MAG: hypothetical protein PHG61_10850 [Candidatus Marinimicrobia bacterium]|nr:hypothetical protein [Candidatus Neomarinimicrobiota bacterium]
MKTIQIITSILTLLMLSGITSLHAEKKNLCEVFMALTENSNDFTPLKGAKMESFSSSYATNIEVDQAEKSYISSFANMVFYNAHYGTYDNESQALAKVTELQNGFKTCFNTITFIETSGTFSERIFRFKQMNTENNDIFRMYKAAFKIAKIGGQYDVTFEYPQTVKNMFTNKMIKSFTDYEGLTTPAANTEFAQSLQQIIREASEDFDCIIREPIDSPNMFERFNPFIAPPGYDNCYIEDRTNNIIYYVIPVFKNVDQPTMNAQAKLIFEKVSAALGSDYAFTVSDDQTEIGFVRKDKPAVTVATLLLTYRAGKFSLTLSIHGAHNPI